MKAGVSIPDEIFAETEHLAKRLKTSPSELYTRALGEFLRRHAPDRATEAMDEVIAVVGETTDAFNRCAGRQVLRKVEW